MEGIDVTRWVGIDEAGYGPNLGPMVMTAVMAESPDEKSRRGQGVRRLDLWNDLHLTVDRAGGDPDRLWVDDSKAIYCGGKGRRRLETSCLAAIHAAVNSLPRSLRSLLEVVGAGTFEDAELSGWLEPSDQTCHGPSIAGEPDLEGRLERRPLVPTDAAWRIVGVRSVVVGPALFNKGLGDHGLKSADITRLLKSWSSGCGTVRLTARQQMCAETSTADATITMARSPGRFPGSGSIAGARVRI